MPMPKQGPVKPSRIAIGYSPLLCPDKLMTTSVCQRQGFLLFNPPPIKIESGSRHEEGGGRLDEKSQISGVVPIQKALGYSNGKDLRFYWAFALNPIDSKEGSLLCAQFYPLPPRMPS